MRNIYSVSAEVKPATGTRGRRQGGTAWEMNEEEDTGTAGSEREDEKAKGSKSGDSLQWVFIKASGES